MQRHMRNRLLRSSSVAHSTRLASHTRIWSRTLSSAVSEEHPYLHTTAKAPPPEGTVVLHNTAVTSRAPKAFSRPPLAIAHGLFGAGINWRSVAKKITPACNVNSLLLDLRNHGSSPHHPEHTYDAMIGDLHYLLTQRYGINTFSLMGHSMGGNMAMRMALKYPDLIDRLIIVDFAPTSYQSIEKYKDYIEIMQSIDLTAIKSRGDVDKIMAHTIHEPLLRAFLVSNLVHEADKSWRWRLNLDALKRFIGPIRSWDIQPQEGLQYKKPTLFVGGGKSQFIKPEYHEKIHAFFPNAKIEMIPDADHWVHFEKPNEFCHAVESFLHRTQQ